MDMFPSMAEVAAPKTEIQFRQLIEPGRGPIQRAEIQKAIDTCSAKGGGTVVLSPGIHETGTIILRSGVTLHLERDAVLLGSTDMNEYVRREGRAGARLNASEGMTALIYADKADRIAVTGEGAVDGNGDLFFVKKEKKDIADWVEEKRFWGNWVPGFENGLRVPLRPKALILLSECTNVRLEVAHVRSSPAWTIHLIACTNAVLKGIALRGALHGSNTDGMDIDACSDVLIEDCDIFTGDDAVCLKNTNMWDLKRPSRRITVRRCLLRSTTHGFTIGTETQDDFEDIVFEDSRIEKPGEFLLITGIGLSILDGGSIKGLRISNVSVDDAVAPIQIRLGNAGRGQKVPVPGKISDLLLENITIRRALGNNMVAGLAGHPLKNVVLRNISLDYAGSIDPSKVLKTVPELDTEFPINEVWKYLPTYGFFCRHVDELDLSNITITKSTKDSRPALLIEDVTGLIQKNVSVEE